MLNNELQYIETLLNRQNYAEVITLCERYLENDSENFAALGSLIIALILSSKDTEAQLILSSLGLQGEETFKQYIDQLIIIIRVHCDKLIKSQNYCDAYLLYFYLVEISPTQIDFYIQLLRLSLLLNIPDSDILPLFSKINSENFENFDALFETFWQESLLASDEYQRFLISIEYAKLCLAIKPNNWSVMILIGKLYARAREHNISIQYLTQAVSFASTDIENCISYGLLTRHQLNSGGHWQEGFKTLKNYNFFLRKVVNSSLKILRKHVLELIPLAISEPHLQDNPGDYKTRLTSIMRVCHDSVNQYSQLSLSHSVLSKPNNSSLKIGYLSRHLYRHPIGWLTRSLIKNHQCCSIETHIFYVGSPISADNVYAYLKIVNPYFYDCPLDHQWIAKLIYEKNIDILIDLDSITMNLTCEVLSLRPAPIQVSWLGFDSSGLPSIDYFIADQYVLPITAQSYYSEKIWRLPNVYLAVTGFEVDSFSNPQNYPIASKNRIFYLSCLKGAKLNPYTLANQFRIIKSSPNSTLFIKCWGNIRTIEELVSNIADSEGVSPECWKLLPLSSSEEIHRSTLSFFDVFLDSFPYTGATTTLEVLWMEIPVVTRVGQQFAARNSYTFLKNAGIEEGIAWTDEEYIEWGIRLGQDEELRKNVSWKLKQAKKHAPLWNAPQFAREVEAAYQAMWHHYVTGEMILPPGHGLG